MRNLSWLERTPFFFRTLSCQLTNFMKVLSLFHSSRKKMQWANHMRIVVAVLSAGVFAASWRFWPSNFEEITLSPVQGLFKNLQGEGATGSSVRSTAVTVTPDFQEEQLNKLRMLKKRFDGIESSIAKIDLLEQSIERIEKTLQAFEKASAEGAVTKTDSPQHDCRFDEVKGYWTPTWKWMNNECKTELDQDKIESCHDSLEKMVFLGDSQMYALYRTFIRQMFSRTCAEIKAGARCNQLQTYYGLQPISADKRMVPDPNLLEGPTSYGKEHPGCTDCSGCEAGLLNCTGVSGSRSSLIEFMPLEFAKDYEQQSTEASTTQENIAIYLSRSQPPPSVVIFNVGLHDSQVLEDGRPNTSPMTPENYIKTCENYQKNLKWFVGVLKKHLPTTRFVFLTTTPKNRKFYIVNDYANPMIEQMNKDARGVMQENGYQAIDVYPLLESEESKSLFSDEVHFHGQGGAYYKTVRSLILRHVCGEK